MTDEDLFKRIETYKDNKESREKEIINHFTEVCDKLLTRKNDVAAMSKLVTAAEDAGINFFTHTFAIDDAALYCYTVDENKKAYGIMYGHVLLSEQGLYTLPPTCLNSFEGPKSLTRRDLNTASRFSSDAEALLNKLDKKFEDIRAHIEEVTK